MGCSASVPHSSPGGGAAAPVPCPAPGSAYDDGPREDVPWTPAHRPPAVQEVVAVLHGGSAAVHAVTFGPDFATVEEDSPGGAGAAPGGSGNGAGGSHRRSFAHSASADAPPQGLSQHAGASTSAVGLPLPPGGSTHGSGMSASAALLFGSNRGLQNGSVGGGRLPPGLDPGRSSSAKASYHGDSLTRKDYELNEEIGVGASAKVRAPAGVRPVLVGSSETHGPKRRARHGSLIPSPACVSPLPLVL